MTIRITGVALRLLDGCVYLPAPARHAEGFWATDKVPFPSGFFVDRREALPIAKAAGQFRAHWAGIGRSEVGAYSGPELFSEDLW